MAVAAATGLSAVAREVVHRVERAATSDTGERLVLRRRRQLREVVPLPCRSMHARLRPTHCASSSSWKRVEPSKFVGVKVADIVRDSLCMIFYIDGARQWREHTRVPAHAGP